YEASIRSQRLAAKAARKPIPEGARVLWLESVPEVVTTPFAANLCWDVSEHGIEQVRLSVDNPVRGTPERVVGTGQSSGERQTGAWVSKGMRFYLRDVDDNALLATIEV